MKYLTKLTFLFFMVTTIACTSESKMELKSEVVNHYSATNYKLIAVEAGIPYGNKIYRWYIGSTPNWIGNRWERQVTNDLKMVFDSTANFQLVDHRNKTSELVWTKNIRAKDTNGAFEIVKITGKSPNTSPIFQGMYSEGKVNIMVISHLRSYQIKLLYPAHHIIRFTGDTMDLFYKNQEAVTGSQFVTYSFIRVK